ncbi:NADH-quinone oxidoreductase subunit C [Desnuesiella massiliensis]|uniref:NADH-quinone oxidoreductase subunit C n=1 Tax=Desnuesiella massiliensis TaxID=1650662 RepID=UPI0006E1DEAA|nr:NADH-quinone oxidoreductase subunit C [Desnuesiella massiliensis]
MIDMTHLLEKLNNTLGGQLSLSENGQAIQVKKEQLVVLMKTLKEDFKYWMLADITSADYEGWYEVVYHLLNDNAELLCIKIKIEKVDNVTPSIPSISSLWKAADPQEREIFDLMGIFFDGHGNLKRILCPEDFVGHPLQKSYKLNPVSRF